MSVQAVILAAGTGSRLRPLTDDRPKAALPLGGRPLVTRALASLAACGVSSVVVVAGHARAALLATLAEVRGRVHCVVVDNPAYATTNTLASLACAERALDGDDFLLLDGDVVFEAEVLRRLDGPGIRLAVDRGRPLDADAVKVAVRGRRITAVGKTLPAGAAGAGESIGIARVDRAAAPALFAASRDLLAAGGAGAYYEAAFQRLIEGGVPFEAADVTGLRWVEIDDHHDLRLAEALFVVDGTPGVCA